MTDEELKELLEKVETGCVDSIKQLLEWLKLEHDVLIDEAEKEKLINSIEGFGIFSRTKDSPDFKERFNDLIEDLYPETYTPETIAKKNNKINEFYSKYFNKLKEFLNGDALEFIIFYEAPPHKFDNYILQTGYNSHYKTILIEYFNNETPGEHFNDTNGENSFDNGFANLLISNKCLFIDILPLPIKIQSEQRKRWSIDEQTHQLFEISLKKIIKHFNLSKKTKFAIGMPPNSSLGIYNCLPKSRYQFQSMFNKNGYYHYQKLIRGNDFLNRSTLKEIEYADTKFNSHKSNVSTGQSPDLTLLKYAWRDENKFYFLKNDINYFISEIYRRIKILFSVLDQQ